MESAGVEDLLKQSMRRDTCSRPRKVRQPDGSHRYVRCQSKKASDCKACSVMHATDQKRLIGSGCNVSERDGITLEDVSGYRFYFVTLTAPSFGAIHRVPKSKDAPEGMCKCGQVHKHGDPLRGTPLNTRWYKYREQVRWNQAASELFRRTVKYTEERLPYVEWSFAREWQVRGALHFHGIVRVPLSYDEAQTWQALQRMRTYSFGEFAWGKEIDVQGIKGDSATGSVRYMAKVVSYSAKQQGDVGLISEDRRRHYERLDWHASRLICGRSGCKGDSTCEGSMHRSFGFAGQMITRSRTWSLAGLTRSTLVEERKQYAAEQVRQGGSKTQQTGLEVLAKAWDTERRDTLRIEWKGNKAAGVVESFFGTTTGGQDVQLSD